MKINYFWGMFILFLGLIVSCSDDDNGEKSTFISKRFLRIDRLDTPGGYACYAYLKDGRLSSIEKGDEGGYKQTVHLSYNGELVSKIQTSNPPMSYNVDFTYSSDTVFASGSYRVNEVLQYIRKDTVIINHKMNQLSEIWGNYTRHHTYNCDKVGNIISVINGDELTYSYDAKPSPFSAIGAPFWLLNYIYKHTYTSILFERTYAGPNNQTSSRSNYIVSGDYSNFSYEYDANSYPIHIFTEIRKPNPAEGETPFWEREYHLTYYKEDGK
ncbi:hypothetical protein [Bacteroides reticulotermitis]|uniref:hypothetical protein n=1 Tax=Bacteroides reticulotermitis TaxID=1133319 RepID=UPI003A8BC712